MQGVIHLHRRLFCTARQRVCYLSCCSVVQETEALGIRAFSFEAFGKLGAENPSPPSPPQPEDLCTIMYTSGTTDKPKVSTNNAHHNFLFGPENSGRYQGMPHPFFCMPVGGLYPTQGACDRGHAASHGVSRSTWAFTYGTLTWKCHYQLLW